MDITNALWITLIGMGLVFAAILALWGLMALLVRLTTRSEEGAVETPATDSGLEFDAIPDGALLLERKRRAAAAAVAFALALGGRRLRSDGAVKAAGTVTIWQAVNRAGQISQQSYSPRKKVVR